MSQHTANPTTEVLITVPPTVAERLTLAPPCQCCPSIASAFGITSTGWGAWIAQRTDWLRFIAYLVPISSRDAGLMADALHLADPEPY